MSNVTVDKDGGIRPAMDNGWRVGMGLPPILKTTLSTGDAANHLSAADTPANRRRILFRQRHVPGTKSTYLFTDGERETL